MRSPSTETMVRRDQFVWSFGPDMAPVISVDAGAVVRLETNDCIHGRVRSETDLPHTIDSSRVNAATGPIEVRGARPELEEWTVSPSLDKSLNVIRKGCGSVEEDGCGRHRKLPDPQNGERLSRPECS